MKYHLVTLGCAKNTVDSMRLERALRNGRHLAVATPEAADLLVLKELCESGRLRPVIDRRFPLSEVASAVRYVEEGHARGNVVITV